LRSAVRSDPLLARDRIALRAWQAARLARTHRDLLESPRYGPAASFFLEELYGAEDHGARDAAVARVLPTLTRIMPASALETIALAIELDELSETLDLALARRLRSHSRGDDLVITEASYAEGYCAAAERRERARQLALVSDIGTALDRFAHKPFIASALAVMEKPARAAGLSALHAFLARGYKVFRQMDGATEFIATITTREQRIYEQLYAHSERPFEV